MNPRAHAVDTLAIMERRGTITAGMRRAAERFRSQFYTAQLDPLQAGDLRRVPAPSGRRFIHLHGPHGSSIEIARNEVWRAVLAMGGPASPAGSCLWHVVGWERTLKDWAAEQSAASGRRITQEAASGMLVAALGTLEGHYAA